jgi:3-dehydroquinate dehydratase-2
MAAPMAQWCRQWTWLGRHIVPHRIVRYARAAVGKEVRGTPTPLCSNLKETAMTVRIMILNGPNLNFLGIREPHIYGSTTLKEIEARCHELAKHLDVTIAFHQTNMEGELVGFVQSARQQADAIIMNPAAYSFTSIALIDALKIFEGPKIEVHISNIHARDELHRHSITSTAATAVICGLGPYGYLAAILAAVQILGKLPDQIPAALNSFQTSSHR